MSDFEDKIIDVFNDVSDDTSELVEDRCAKRRFSRRRR